MRRPLVLVSGLVLATGLFAQAPKVEFPASSPAATVKQRVGLTDVEIVTTRAPARRAATCSPSSLPTARSGAPAPTPRRESRSSTAVKLNGADIPAGSYGLYTIPGEKEWTVIIDKNSKMWGAYDYDQKDDLVRFKATPVALSEPVETFTIEIDEPPRHVRNLEP